MILYTTVKINTKEAIVLNSHQKNSFYCKKVLTNDLCYGILSERQKFAGVAQLVEQLICNQQVGGSSPSTSSKNKPTKYSRLYIWEISRVAKGDRL